MTDSSATVARLGVPVAGEEDRMYDGYSDRDDNSSIAPFPPYRERDDYEDSLLEEAVAIKPDDDNDDNDDDEAQPPKPTLAVNDNDNAEANTTTHTDNTRVRLFSDTAQRSTSPTSTTSSTSHELPSKPPSKPPSPQPAPPPPYWKHSCDVNDADDAANTPTQGQGQGQGHDPNGAEQPASPSTPVVEEPPTPKPRPQGLSLFSRPTAPSSKNKSKSKQDGSSVVSPSSSQNGHRRNTSSSSTLDFAANMITLQDNEAAEITAYEDASAITSPAASTSSSQQQQQQQQQRPSVMSRGFSSSHAWLFGLDTPAAASSSSLPTGRSGSVPVASGKSSSSRCWARRVDITDYTVINGSGGLSFGGGGGGGGGIGGSSHPRIGAFVVWTVRVETLGTALPFSPTARVPAAAVASALPSPLPSPSATAATSPTGTVFCIYKRYSEFDTLRRHLVTNFPQARRGGALPPLPPKSVLGKFRPAFLEQRRLGLQYFLNCILLNPEFSGSPVLQEFLFG